LFDNIKDKFGARVFGKGYMYRIVSKKEVEAVGKISKEEKENGIDSKHERYVPYDKGDKEGNRWYLETPYYINWAKNGIKAMKNLSGNRWDGSNFFFRNGFCVNNVLNPNSSYFKARLKDKTVNDVASMSLYDETELGDKYFVISLNSYFHFKMLREFINTTVNIQINDLKKLPIKIPTDKQLSKFNEKFDACFKIKQQHFAGEINEAQADALLQPIEREIDWKKYITQKNGCH